MSMLLIDAIRKLGWPDAKGQMQYGNAAILCYFSDRKHPAVRFVEKYKDVRVVDLLAKHA